MLGLSRVFLGGIRVCRVCNYISSNSHNKTKQSHTRTQVLFARLKAGVVVLKASRDACREYVSAELAELLSVQFVGY